jgi:hypothetical protein
MENLPTYVSLLFVLTTLGVIWLFYHASNRSNLILAITLIWLVLQGILSYKGFYLITTTLPPRFVLLIGPPLLLIIFLFSTRWGQKFIDALDVEFLTWIHVVRLPVELILHTLFLYKLIPEIMTFQGMNFDIFSGITAPVIVYFGYRKRKFSKNILLAWNCLCLALLFNIVTMAVLAAPFQFQQIAFDQPNVGVLYFPFTWLPCFIVPVVLFSHLAGIRRLLRSKNQ